MVPTISIPTSLRIIELFEQRRFLKESRGEEDDSEQKAFIGEYGYL